MSWKSSTSRAIHARDTGFYWLSKNALHERFIASSGVGVWMKTLQLIAKRWKNDSVLVWIQLNSVWLSIYPLWLCWIAITSTMLDWSTFWLLVKELDTNIYCHMIRGSGSNMRWLQQCYFAERIWWYFVRMWMVRGATNHSGCTFWFKGFPSLSLSAPVPQSRTN